ncbi:Probable phospholipase A2 homolog 1 [Linum grandiflorum]
MPLLYTSTRMRINGLVVAFTFMFLFLFAPVPSSSATNGDGAQAICSRTCIVQNCDSFGIRYGKYCGLGWTGCSGEKPCDDLDACCKIHDDCVGKKGLTNIKCHEKFKKCAKKVQKSGKVGFSKQCSYDKAIPTMINALRLTTRGRLPL